MKTNKILALLLVFVMSFALVACGPSKANDNKDKPAESGQNVADNGDKGQADADQANGEQEFTGAYFVDPSTLDYLVSNASEDAEVYANLVDSLYENDQFGNLVPCLAESYEANKEATKFTYHLKKGIMWYTATGEEYAEVTAHDFVTAVQHAADFQSPVLPLISPYITNLQEYMDGKVDFDQVGIKALDDYTLEYDLKRPVPYFHTMTVVNCMFPINKEFLESKGAGCELGKPDKTNCAFGQVKPDSILYNGCYILSVADKKSKIEYRKNPNYWDKDNVHYSKLTLLFDDGKDPYSIIKGFESGLYSSAGLRPIWKDFDKYLEKYKDNAFPTLPNSFAFAMNFNYNRKTFDHTSKNEAEREATHKAILNEHFRRSLLYALDRVSYLRQAMPPEIAVATLRNANTAPNLVVAPDGRSYGKLVDAAYQELEGKKDVSLADGQDPFFSKENALAEIEKAKEEGVEFPVTLDTLYIDGDDEVFVKRAKSMKESIEKNTDGQIIINIIPAPRDEVNKLLYTFENPDEADYDINTFAGWGADYGDPQTYSAIYNGVNGDFLKNEGLHPLGKDPSSDAVLNDEKVGFKEYTDMYQKASQITDDMQKRYEAFAKVDAYAVHKALFVPMSMRTRGLIISRRKPFAGPYSVYGYATLKAKGVRLLDHMITKAEFEKAKEAWENGKTVD